MNRQILPGGQTGILSVVICITNGIKMDRGTMKRVIVSASEERICGGLENLIGVFLQGIIEDI